MATSDFIKKNIKSSSEGLLGKGFIGLDIASLVTGHDKMKALWSLMKDMILLGPTWSATLATAFLGMGKAVRALVHDTGSLEAALKKLAQIQDLQKVFTPLMGGAAAAKLKVAELVNFAASRNIKLGDAAEATRSLELMTKGGFSSAKALDTINDAAKATGNSVVDMADAVGEFSEQLQSGGSIDGATEHLRKMGAISGTTADQLIQLQKNGAGASTVFNTMTESLDKFQGGAKEAEDSVEGINEAYEKAKTNLQEKFGAPWTEADTVNTKNYAEAMNGVAPAVERVSKFFAVLFNSFSTFKSSVAETIGSSQLLVSALEALIYTITGLIAAVSLAGAASLTGWLLETVMATESATIAIAALTGAIGVFASVAIIAVGIGLAWSASVEKAAKSLQDLQHAQNEANSAMQVQIHNARTLAQRHDALAKSLDAVTAAQVALNEAYKNGNEDQVKNAESALEMAKSTSRKAQLIKSESLEASPEKQQAQRDKVRREIEQKEQRFQGEMSVSTPERQARLLAQHAAEATTKAQKGEVGEKARIEYARKSDEAANTLKDRQAKFEQAKLVLAKEDHLRMMQKNTFGVDTRTDEEKQRYVDAQAGFVQASMFVDRAKDRQSRLGQNAPEGTSVRLEADQRKMLASFDPDRARKAAEIGLQAERARAQEAMRGENELIALRDKEAAKAIERETKLNKLAIDRELEMQDAMVKMDSDKQKSMKDASVFMDKYQEYRNAGLSESESKDKANKFAENAITLDTRATAGEQVGSIVADSLTKVGGGGGVYAPTGGDPMLTAAQRQVTLHEQEVEYLKVLAGDVGKEGGVL